MKKFLITLFILLLAGGAVFYFGWTQIKLDRNQYAVLFTKTSGYTPEVLEPGTFYWHGERLIPTNSELYIFTLDPRTVRLSESGELPSADLYAAELEAAAPFQYSMEFQISYRIKPALLPGLVAEEQLSPETLETWYQIKEEQLVIEAAEALGQAIDPTSVIEAGALERQLKRHLIAAFPELDIYTIRPLAFQMPDLELYRRTRELYIGLLEEKQQAEVEILRQSIQQSAQHMSRLETLSGYGQILTDYPVLLDLMEMQGETGINFLEDYLDTPIPTE